MAIPDHLIWIKQRNNISHQVRPEQAGNIRQTVPSSLPLQLELAGLVESAPALLDDEPRREVTRLDAVLHVLPDEHRRQEPPDERVPRAVRVHERLLRQERHGVLGHGPVARHDGRRRPLRENHGPRLAALLRARRDLQGDLLEVLPVVPEPVLLPVGGRLALVAEEVVGVLEGRGDLVAEEVDDERGREVEAERLARGERVLGDDLERVDRNGEEEAGDVVALGRLVDGLRLGGLDVGRLEVVRGVELRHERPLAALDEDGADARGRGGVLHVVYLDAVLGGAGLELLAELVGADAAHVGRLVGPAVGAEDPLRDTDGVLRGPPGDVLRAVVVDQLLVEGHVLLLGEDGVVQLHGVLVENLLADLRGDVEERVAHAH
mmetsp:Transcript_19244/g.42798  ORF Transcript_19244/g.42798 Transcript_19244/m.42798 type:complete len:378 (-) Transcript_19244:91-1224(-)